MLGRAALRGRRATLCTPAVYHAQRDFDWDEHAARVAPLLPQPQLPSPLPDVAPSTGLAAQTCKWENFHVSHAEEGARFFRERRYLMHQFPQLRTGGLRVLEVGCGSGGSVLPVLRGNATAHVTASDPSATAVAITRRLADESGHGERCATHVAAADCDVGRPESFDAALLVFTLSALATDAAQRALVRALAAALRPGGSVLFRDYGLYDVRMLKDAERSARLPDGSFLRAGGTVRRYFALDEVRSLADDVGLCVDEARYCCISLPNRKRGTTMERVFVHAVLSKPLSV